MDWLEDILRATTTVADIGLSQNKLENEANKIKVEADREENRKAYLNIQQKAEADKILGVEMTQKNLLIAGAGAGALLLIFIFKK